MYITLSQLQSRIETVRREIGDHSRMALLRINVNGHWIEPTADTFILDDSGALIIGESIPEAISPTLFVADDSEVEPTAPPSWKAAFERYRKNQYTDYESVTMFNFSRERMQDAVDVAAAADEAIEWGCRWESLASAQMELIQKLEHEVQMLKHKIGPPQFI
jgi:hypothetical protein